MDILALCMFMIKTDSSTIVFQLVEEAAVVVDTLNGFPFLEVVDCGFWSTVAEEENRGLSPLYFSPMCCDYLVAAA
jgi:hypothetical protein